MRIEELLGILDLLTFVLKRISRISRRGMFLSGDKDARMPCADLYGIEWNGDLCGHASAA
jgi:hypothetical protein